MQWYYKKDGGLVPGGPADETKIRYLIAEKIITPETGLCLASELSHALEHDQWLPARESEFAECFGAAVGDDGNLPRWEVRDFVKWLVIGAISYACFAFVPEELVGLSVIAICTLFISLIKTLAFVIVRGIQVLTGENIDRNVPGGLLWVFVIILVFGILGAAMNLSSAKPVIYLYPEREMDVRVQLNYDGKLDTTYPAYPEGGWLVTARPDGTLIDKADGREYSYLFWDGFYDNKFDFSKGFIVKGTDTARFLQDTLSAMGLTPREYNEFIVYWLPKMQNNAYNLIAFQGAEYTDHARLTVTPKPDSLLRVFMAFKSVPYPYPIPPQTFPKFERRGFTVIEWGGSDAGDKKLRLW